MGRFNFLQSNFLLGEVSPKLLGHSDEKEYLQMAQKIENAIVLKQGGASMRPGTQYVAKTVASTAIPAAARLFTFVVSKTESYQVVVCIDHTIGTLVGITIVNTNTFTEAAISDGRAGGYPTFIGYDNAVGGALGISDLKQSQFAQSGDLFVIVNGGHSPIYLLRLAINSFVLTDQWTLRTVISIFNSSLRAIRNSYGGSLVALQAALTPSAVEGSGNIWSTVPYGLDLQGYSVTASATTGNINLTWTIANVAYKKGDILRMDKSGTTGFMVLTNAGGTTATVLKALPDTGTNFIQPAIWADTRGGWPRTVCFYQQRLLFGGSAGFKNTIWGSHLGDITEFMLIRPLDDTNYTSLTNDRPFQFALAAPKIADIQWMESDKDLFVGTGSAEYIAAGTDGQYSLGPINVGFGVQTTYGSERVQAKNVDGTIQFVQRGGLKVREMLYSFYENKRSAYDLTKFSEHMPYKGVSERASFAVPAIQEIAYQALDNNITWFLDSNNCLFGLTRDRYENVMAWHFHKLGGVINTSETPKVISISACPTPNGDSDELWMLVQRTVNGADTVFLEKMGKSYRLSSVYNSSTNIQDKLVLSDCAKLQRLGSPGNTFNGFAHLKNMAVEVFADGNYLGSITVDNSGNLVLPGPTTYTEVIAGLAYTAKIKPMPITAGSIMGSADSTPKRVDSVVLRFENTIGAKFGHTDDSSLEAISFRDASLANGTPTPMFTGIQRKSFKGPVEEDAQIFIESNGAVPFTLTALTVKGNTYE